MNTVQFVKRQNENNFLVNDWQKQEEEFFVEYFCINQGITQQF